MCGTCGCGNREKAVITDVRSGRHVHLHHETAAAAEAKDVRAHSREHAHEQAHAHPAHPAHHHHDEHDHDHGHDHTHDHAHSHADAHPHQHVDDVASHVHDGHDDATRRARLHAAAHGAEGDGETLQLQAAILRKNDELAARNRAWFAGREILAINLVSGPGAGKTTLLERTISAMREQRPVHVIEGDQQTLNDAERIHAAGAPAVQVNTGTGCHLEADMVMAALRQLKPPPGAVVFIENVGNLVCPALFDLGETLRVAMLSVTEGDDKPLKYPHMFHGAQLLLLNKIDLAPHVPFDVQRCIDNARQVNPDIEVLQLSALTGDGMQDWLDWLERQAEQVSEQAFA